jgi:hypothetical protein
MDLWPAYLGYVLMAPAVAASLYVGFKSVSDARTNASVTESNIAKAGGSCPTADPRFAASCSSYANDISLVNTDKTVAYSLGAGGAVLFAASTIYLAVAFSHNARREPVPAPQQGGITVVPILNRAAASLAVSGAF